MEGEAMRRRPIKPNTYQIFSEHLSDLGFRDYNDYLHSDIWQSFNQWYKSKKTYPQQCLVCGSVHFVLHHWTYVRVGYEDLQDVIPLCDYHHEQIHRYLANSKTKLGDLKKQFIECFNICPSEAQQKLKPFFKKRVDGSKLRVKKLRRKR